MQAILYVSHGTRCHIGQAQVAELMQYTMPKINAPIQEYCFLELAKPSLEEGVISCVKKGATRIAVVPLLLLLTSHAKYDIPNQLKKIQKKFPDIPFSYGRPLGVHDAIIDILVDRMLEKQQVIKESAQVLLVGRGSSDPDTKRYFYEIEQRLKRKITVSNVTTCYLAACEPNVETGLASVIASREEQIFVVPYLLFTGMLMQSLERTVTMLFRDHHNVFLCRPFHFHENIVRLLSERVRETTIARCI